MKFTPFDLSINIDGMYGFKIFTIETESAFRSLFGVAINNQNYNYTYKVEISIFFRLFFFR